MHKKYYAWSFDDGLEQDKRIVETLRAYRESNWGKFERICAAVTAHDDIVCCSMDDAFASHEGGV